MALPYRWVGYDYSKSGAGYYAPRAGYFLVASMTTAQIEIRRLTETDAADAARYRAIRLEALEANPEAFGSTVEMESAQPLSWFSDRLANSTILGGFRDGELVATAGFVVQQGSKNSHKGTIWGLYVRPDARSTGTGRRLVEAILDLARHRVELVQLTVATPGHTPGHQSLLVKLPKTGAVVLSGDAVHFRSNWDNRRVPALNVSKEQTLVSMQKLSEVLNREKAQLWINHDKAQRDSLKLSPAFYD